MSEAVIVALITGGLTLVGTILTVVFSHKSTLAALDKKSEISDEKIHGEINVIKTQIQTLSDRVEKHNNMIERTYELERKMSVAEERISDAHHRINELRDDGR